MKKIIFFFVLCAFVSNTHAQLLKKLKDKAAQALEKKPANNTTNNNSAGDNNAAAETQNSKLQKKQTQPDSLACKMIGQLEEGETFLYDETNVIANNNALSYAFVIRNKEYKYFVIENGKRLGPYEFNKIPIKSAKPSNEEFDEGNYSNKDEEVRIGNDDKDPVTLKYSKTISNNLHIVINGKNYGPYDYIAKIIPSEDKKHFFALVTIGGENAMTNKMGMGNTYIVNEAGLKKQIGTGITVPMKFSVSRGFKNCMATVMDSKNQKVITVSSTGKSEENNMADIYANKNIRFVNDDGDIVTIPSQSPTQILVNGNEAASFSVPIKNMANLFLMPDVSKSVYYEKGKIYRPDGTEEKTTGIIFPKVATVDNKTSLYYFKVYTNDAGIKEIYLCNKSL